MSLNTRIAILKLAAATFLIGPGLLMVIAPVTPFMAWVEAFLDLAYQPFDGGQRITESSGLLLNAILGGILVGFGVMIWLVADRVYRHDMALGRSLILIPILSWFICDSTGSVISGAWFNAVLNAVFVTGFLIPLLWKSNTASAA